MEELLLWRWSTAVQITSALLVALFFLVFGRSVQRIELRPWIDAWLANALALTVTWIFWIWQPGGAATTVLLITYLACKTSFVVWLWLGTAQFVGNTVAAPRSVEVLLPVATFAALGGLMFSNIDMIGIGQASVIAVALFLGARVCWAAPAQGLGWLGFGFALRGSLALIEAVAYGWRFLSPEADTPAWVGIFLASHSSFDTGAEWVIVLGSVLAMAQRTLGELAQSHDQLHQAHEELTRVAERDPLTGLYNRRMLPALFRHGTQQPMELLFFDLDGFKAINDQQGHECGDACLKRFTAALQAEWPEALGLVRFAGDEFIALLPANPQEDDWQQRVEGLRQRLRQTAGSDPVVRFSVGHSRFAGDGEWQAALHEADLAMYREKSARRQHYAQRSDDLAPTRH